jgi:glycosyltransferase involved in cell wall biosynthesis
MKIGLIIYGSLETISGGYLYDRKLVDYLRAQGDVVDIISQPWSAYGRHLSHNFSRDMRRRLQKASFDVLLQDELNHPSLFWLNGRLRPHLPYPLISIVHHLRSSEAHPRAVMPLYRQVERRYLRSVDGFVYNSQTTKWEVEKMTGSESPHVVATPAGDRFKPVISSEEIVSRCREPGPLRLLFVGNVIARKGLHMLVTALSQLPEMDWRLDVVGETAVDPAYTRRIQQQITQSGLADRITIHGPVSDADLAQQYRRSHLLVVPSQYEGFGIVYLEGMSFGLPAIGAASGGAGEIIQNGENGYLVDVGETVASARSVQAVLARHVQHLHQNRAALTQLSLNARQSFLTWPPWEESMAKIRAFLQSEISQKHQRRGAEAQR